MDEAHIVLRAYDPDKDEALIYSSWRNSSFYHALIAPAETAPEFFKSQSTKIKKVLESAQVRVACVEDCPEMIVGYSVYTGTHLDWIYVKRDYRRKGIGTLLFPKEITTVTPTLTKIGAVIATKKNLKPQGESNGEESRSSPRAQEASRQAERDDGRGHPPQ